VKRLGNRRRNYSYPDARAEGREYHNDQRHVHELQGSVMIAEEEEDPHNHRFCTVTEEAIPYGADDHVHEVCFRTDFFNEHYHEFKGKTGCAIPVGNRHVHFIDSITTVDDGHRHEFEAATMINNLIGKEHRHDCLRDYMQGMHDEHHH
jgi:hypothetical protein